MTNSERDDYIKSTHDAVIRLEETVKNHLDNKVVHTIPPCDTVKKIEERNWKVSLALFMASLGCIGSLIMLILAWNK